MKLPTASLVPITQDQVVSSASIRPPNFEIGGPSRFIKIFNRCLQRLSEGKNSLTPSVNITIFCFTKKRSILERKTKQKKKTNRFSVKNLIACQSEESQSNPKQFLIIHILSKGKLKLKSIKTVSLRFLLSKAGDVEANPGPRRLVQVITYNVNGGFQAHKKQKRLINKCLRIRTAGIFMFQETHLTIANEFVLKARWPHHFVASHGDNSSAGVLTLYRKDDWDEVLYNWSDNEGRICIIVLKKSGQYYAFVNVYAYNSYEKNITFYKDIDNKLEHLTDLFPNIDIIMGGDFNVTLSMTDNIDRPNCEVNVADALKAIIDKQTLIDCKKNMYPEVAMPTFKRGQQ